MVKLKAQLRPVNFLSVLATGYALCLDLFILLHYTVGERWKLIAALNNAGQWLLMSVIPCALLILVMPVSRLRRFVAALPPLLLLLILYGGEFLPKSSPSVPTTTFTVATFNMTGELTDPEIIPERAQAVEDIHADIVGTQEFDFPDRYIPLLSSTYPYYFTPADFIGTPYDMPYALFSRYPINKGETRLVGYFPSRSRAVAARFIVTINAEPVSIYIMHSVRPVASLSSLNYDADERHAGTLDVIEAVRQEHNPVIVLCDCNMSDQTEDYTAMATVLSDSWRERGFGLGFTDPATQDRFPFPLLRGDYIWHSAGLQAVTIQLLPNNGGSDHFPLFAQFALPSS